MNRLDNSQKFLIAAMVLIVVIAFIPWKSLPPHAGKTAESRDELVEKLNAKK